MALAWCRGWGAGRRYPGHLPNEDPGVDSARGLVLEEAPPCPSGRGPALQGLLGTPGLDQRAALPVPESRLSEWARAWWHTRGRAGGLGRECIYKCCLQSKFRSILTSSLFPGALVSTPPAPPAPLPSGVLSLCHFVILAQTAIYGGQHFLPLFPLPVGPLAPSQKHSRALSNSPVPGAGEAGRRGPQLGPPIVHQAPHPTSPTPPPHARLASPGQHNGATSKFSFSAVSFQGPSPPPSDSPSTPRVGVGIRDRFSIAACFEATMWLFFPNRLNLSTKHIFSPSPPHQGHSRDGREKGREREGQTDSADVGQ